MKRAALVVAFVLLGGCVTSSETPLPGGGQIVEPEEEGPAIVEGEDIPEARREAHVLAANAPPYQREYMVLRALTDGNLTFTQNLTLTEEIPETWWLCANSRFQHQRDGQILQSQPVGLYASHGHAVIITGDDEPTVLNGPFPDNPYGLIQWSLTAELEAQEGDVFVLEAGALASGIKEMSVENRLWGNVSFEVLHHGFAAHRCGVTISEFQGTGVAVGTMFGPRTGMDLVLEHHAEKDATAVLFILNPPRTPGPCHASVKWNGTVVDDSGLQPMVCATGAHVPAGDLTLAINEFAGAGTFVVYFIVERLPACLQQENYCSYQ